MLVALVVMLAVPVTVDVAKEVGVQVLVGTTVSVSFGVLVAEGNGSMLERVIVGTTGLDVGV